MADVLIIEPDRTISKTYAVALSNAGNQVRMAADAQTAIHAADKHTPDVIVLEIKLSAHSGIEFLYELRSYPEWQQIPVLALTSLTAQELGVDSSAWQKLGRIEYLSKSTTTLAKLVRAVERTQLSVR